jgi:hypothetical protein
MSNAKRSPNLIPAVGFRVLTCGINEEDDTAVFTDSPLIGWIQTDDPLSDPVVPIILDDSGPVVGPDLEAYQVAYRVFPSEWHDGQRFRLKAELEKEARFLLETASKAAGAVSQ